MNQTCLHLDQLRWPDCAMSALSTVGMFDDIRRCIDVLTDGTAEEEFLRMLKMHGELRQQLLLANEDTQRIQKELDSSLQNMADLETKLFHARRLLEMESKARREAEDQRDLMERKIVAVADLVQNEQNMRDETRDKIATLSTLPRKLKSVKNVQQKHGDINSTGSFLSDLSITQSEDDFLDMNNSVSWRKHRPSLPKNAVPYVGTKRSRLSGGAQADAVNTRKSQTRRSGTVFDVQKHAVETTPHVERICATTTVTIPENGVIKAESTIESTPLQKLKVCDTATTNNTDSPFKLATAPVMSPSSAKVFLNSPAQQLRTNFMRKHNFATKTFIRTETCQHCQRKIRFGSVGLRCRDCSVRCHPDCRYLLTLACVPQSNTPTLKGPLGSIADYAPALAPMIPALIVHCVNEIETRGLQEVGLYRVCGTEREIKALKERFLRGKTTPHLGNIDVHVLCGCVKDFLRSLRETLIPSSLWKDFCNAVQKPDELEVQKDLYKAVGMLPQANRDTLAFLILHFQRIAMSPDVCMPLENLARVFGPTIVGFSSPTVEQHMYAEVYMQCTVMTQLLKMPMDYWTQFVDVDMPNKENKQQSNINKQQTPKAFNKQDYLLYASPNKSTVKKRKFFDSPTFNSNKK